MVLNNQLRPRSVAIKRSVEHGGADRLSNRLDSSCESLAAIQSSQCVVLASCAAANYVFRICLFIYSLILSFQSMFVSSYLYQNITVTVAPYHRVVVGPILTADCTFHIQVQGLFQ